MSLVIPMRKRNRDKLIFGRPARPLAISAGLAACFAVWVVVSLSFGEERAPGVTVPGAAAQPVQRPVQITNVVVTYLPNEANVRLSEIGFSTYRRGYWMRILIQFTSQPDWASEIRFDCYVLLQDGRQERMLTGSVTCVDVPSGRNRAVCLYVPPNTLERYGGRAQAVAVECNYQGTVVSDYSMPRRRWWEDYSGISNSMVTWFYTPFSRTGIEMFQQIRPEGRGF